ncbi:hypothetical protein V8E36_008207 [Tilletia maclaganii]
MHLKATSLLLLLAVGTALSNDRGPRKQPLRRDTVKADANDSTADSLVSRDSRLHPGPFLGVKGTWYKLETGEVDCGGYYTHADHVVALNQDQYGNLDSRSPYCGHKIRITANGKSALATIVDACPKSPKNCHWGALDMSKGLFSHFADLSVGELDISWHLVDGDKPGSHGEAKPPPHSSHVPPPSKHHPPHRHPSHPDEYEQEHYHHHHKHKQHRHKQQHHHHHHHHQRAQH